MEYRMKGMQNIVFQKSQLCAWSVAVRKETLSQQTGLPSIHLSLQKCKKTATFMLIHAIDIEYIAEQLLTKCKFEVIVFAVDLEVIC